MIKLRRNRLFGYGSAVFLIILSMLVLMMSLVLKNEPSELIIYILLIVFVTYLYFDISFERQKPLPASAYLLVVAEHIPLSVILLISSSAGFTQIFKSEPESMLSFLIVCIAVPIFEELVCRGVLMDRQLESLSPMKAIFINSIIFSALHLPTGPVMMFRYMTTALILAYAYYRYRSLFLCSLIHGFTNFSEIMKGYFTDTRTMFIYSFSVLVITMILIILMIPGRKRQRTL